ncbi:MAG: phosphatase PAP2 family protein [Comamonas sp.]
MKKTGAYLFSSLFLLALALWVDLPLTRLIHENLTPTLDAFFDDLSDVAHTETYALLALGAYGIGLWALSIPAVAQRWKAVLERLVRGGLFMLLTMLSGGIVVLVLKHAVARARPSMLLEQSYYGLAAPFSGSPFNSFPSSHTLTAFAVAAVLARLLPAWRLPLLALASIVGACRILTLEHFLTDVIVAALIAMACARFWAPRILDPAAQWPLRQPWRWHKA